MAAHKKKKRLQPAPSPTLGDIPEQDPVLAPKPIGPGFDRVRRPTIPGTLLDLERGTGQPGSRGSGPTPDFIPQLPQQPTDRFAQFETALGISRTPLPQVSERQLRTDRTNFLIRQREDQRRLRLGLPPRPQRDAIPPLSTFARIRDASQISDSQIPGGVATLTVPFEQVNPANLRDNQVYRTVDGNFVRFNAETPETPTPMEFNPLGGPNQEGQFEIDDKADVGRTEALEFVDTSAFNLMHMADTVRAKNPALAANFEARARSLQAIRNDEGLSSDQIRDATRDINKAAARLFPVKTETEKPELPIHEAKDKFSDIDEEGNVWIWNEKTQSLSYKQATAPKDTVPLNQSSTLSNYLTKGTNFKNFFEPIKQKHFIAAASNISNFVVEGLRVHTAGTKGAFKRLFRVEDTADADVAAYVADVLPTLGEAIQPAAKALLDSYIALGGEPLEKDLVLLEDSTKKTTLENFIFQRIDPLDFTPEARKLINDRAMGEAQETYEQVIQPGLPKGPPQPVSDTKINLGGKETPGTEIDGVFYPVFKNAEEAAKLPAGTVVVNEATGKKSKVPPNPLNTPNASN